MVNRKRVAIILALAVAAIAAWHLLQSDEVKVRKQLNLLAELISKEGEESTIMAAQRGHSIGKIFTDPSAYETDAHTYSGSYSRQQIARQALLARAGFTHLRLKLHDISITFTNKIRAGVILTANVAGETKAGDKIDNAHEIELTLSKTEKKWLISRIKVVEVLVR